MAIISLQSEALAVAVSTQGAELQSLKTASGMELLWQADPAVWPRHAPHLFPIVGRLKNDTLLHQGKSYNLTQHGFARDLPFECEASSSSSCTMLLRDSPETRSRYPFAFELRISHTLSHNALEIGYALKNPAATELLASVGTHPAFMWPLTAGAQRHAHAIVFEQEEPAPIRRVKGGLLQPDFHPTPVQGKVLQLRDELFAEDVVIFDQLRSRSLEYKTPGAPTIRVEFEDFPYLGIWTKPGAGFVCIEPWQGHASPEEFAGEFRDKPGVVSLRAGEERVWRYTIRVE